MVESWVLAANVKQVNADVRSSGFLSDLGTIGDTSHQLGAGDHTPWSTHVGKFGYPDQGQVHAQDIGGSDFYLDLIETFIRRSWRRGELAGLKYFNALNRHWNVQSWGNWDRAVDGSLQSTYSTDHHVHLSFENGDVDGNLIERFQAWLNNGQQFGSSGGVEDDMGRLDEVYATGSDGENRTLAQQIHDLHEVLVEGNGFSKDGYTRAFARRAWEEEDARLAAIEKDLAEIKAKLK